MTARPIGYYVHHHGDGHRQRALAIAARAQGRITVLGTGLAGRTGAIPCIDLPDDRLEPREFDGRDASARRPHALHYAPVDHGGIRLRIALITDWIAAARPALMVVDVSAEVAMLARLASVPTVYVRLSGRRDDAPHREAFRGATALLSPFHALLDDDATPAELRTRTIYAPGLGERPDPAVPEPHRILGVVGRGGAPIDVRRWAAAAAATPDWSWTVIGDSPMSAGGPPNLRFAGWVGDATAQIARAGVVVGAAGDGLVGTVLAARRPFICVPEDRPFDEQRAKAARLAALGAAVVCPTWPVAEQWPTLLDQARAIDPALLASLDDPTGAARAAARLCAVADAAGTQPGASA